MLRIDWTTRALADLDRLEAFLFERNPYAASRAIAAITAATVHLAQFPHSGRPAPEDFRELVVKYSASGYFVLYRVKGDVVRIVRVRHQREAGY